MGFHAKSAFSNAADEAVAIAEIRRQIDDGDLKAVLLFVTDGYRLEILAGQLRQAFSVPVFGCTTAGTIGPGGYHHHGIQAVGICGTSVSLAVELIHPLDQCQNTVSALGRRLEANPPQGKAHRFGLLLVDGLSRMEERLAASLHHCLPDIPLIGGSAGDDLAFKSTFVYAHGRFLADAAVFAVFETDTPFTTFKFQHFEPTDELLVVTEADAETRTVHEINGEPAALAYARKLGLRVTELSPDVFSRAPMLLKLGGEHYVRSMQRCNDDLSLTFYCAIAQGIVLRLGKAVNPLEAFEKAFAEVRLQVPNPSLVIGCDCILRRLEFEQNGLEEHIGLLLTQHKVIGFSTYGEQFNALHMNQTFTGLAVGNGE